MTELISCCIGPGAKLRRQCARRCRLQTSLRFPLPCWIFPCRGVLASVLCRCIGHSFLYVFFSLDEVPLSAFFEVFVSLSDEGGIMNLESKSLKISGFARWSLYRFHPSVTPNTDRNSPFLIGHLRPVFTMGDVLTTVKSPK